MHSPFDRLFVFGARFGRDPLRENPYLFVTLGRDPTLVWALRVRDHFFLTLSLDLAGPNRLRQKLKTRSNTI